MILLLILFSYAFLQHLTGKKKHTHPPSTSTSTRECFFGWFLLGKIKTLNLAIFSEKKQMGTVYLLSDKGRHPKHHHPSKPSETSARNRNEMGVSRNNGTPKSSILIGFSIISHTFWGTPIFGNTQMIPFLH